MDTLILLFRGFIIAYFFFLAVVAKPVPKYLPPPPQADTIVRDHLPPQGKIGYVPLEIFRNLLSQFEFFRDIY